MEITQKQENGIVRIIIKGRLDAESAPLADRIVKGIIAKENPRLLFDLCGLDYVSSAGLRVILTAAKDVFKTGGEIVLCCLNEFVRDVFESSQFPIADTVAEGIEKFS